QPPSQQPNLLSPPPPTQTHPYLHRLARLHTTCRSEVKSFLSSRAQHYTVLALVSFDLLGIFADIIINLYQCDEKNTDPKWGDVRNGLGIAGLVFSCLFMVELVLSIWAFGFRYFQSWFHSFDATVILAGFVVDVLLHGVLEEVASLVVVLRLWRFFKIIEEFSVGAEEQMDGLEMRIEQLESENGDLKRELRRQKGTIDEEAAFQGGSAQWK
ncbi:Voltage-gated hydrogen channel, partial [Lachnellula suecica]